MLGIRYMKAPPTTYVLHFKSGRVKRKGSGLSFFYFAPTSTIVGIPLASRDAPFVFNEVTADFQEITVQGRITYRIAKPDQVATLLDFRIDGRGKHETDDPELLGERLIHAAQILTRGSTQRMTLAEALVGSQTILDQVLGALGKADLITSMGLEILDMAIVSIRPTPDMARALEAEAREALSRRADEAIYSRRNAAVLEERKIKESELNTELAVEAKKRQIRETQIAADISVEEERQKLLERKVANDRQEADTRAYALAAVLEPLKAVDWRTLMAAAASDDRSQLMISMAFRDIADNAAKIGQLNISPELLAALSK